MIRRIHLEKVDSTNNYIRRLIDRGEAGEGLLLVDADDQYAGRGQRGNTWESEEGKNLSFSVLCHPLSVSPSRQFILSQTMALAVVDVLKRLEAEQRANGWKSNGGVFTVKWPNDIYYGNLKICGTLIECDLQGKSIRNCIIGTGLNVNQSRFMSDAPNPVSLLQIFGKEFDREMLLDWLSATFEQLYETVMSGGEVSIRDNYMLRLYRRTGMHAYKDVNGVFMAEIADVESSGRLLLRDSDGRLRRYEFKEVDYLV